MEHPLDLVRSVRARDRRRAHRHARGSIRGDDLRAMVIGGIALGSLATVIDLGSNRVRFGGNRTAAAPVAARSFGLCHVGGGIDCVVDGDTFWIDGEKVRVADIDAPETHPPRCDAEARLGEAATLRLQALLNAGPVTLVTEGRATDRYGRALRVVERGGESIGGMLVAEGLARRWEGRRRPWC